MTLIDIEDAAQEPRNRVGNMMDALSTYLGDVTTARHNVTKLNAHLRKVNMQIAAAQQTIQTHAGRLLDPSPSTSQNEAHRDSRSTPSRSVSPESDEEDHTAAIDAANARVRELQIEKRRITCAMRDAKEYLRRLEKAIQPLLEFVRHVSVDGTADSADHGGNDEEGAELTVRLREDYTAEAAPDLEDRYEAIDQGSDDAPCRVQSRCHKSSKRRHIDKSLEGHETRGCGGNAREAISCSERRIAPTRKRKVAEIS